MDYDILPYAVIIVAFIIGYMIVGFIIKHLKKLRDLPPYHKETWKNGTGKQGETENRESNFSKYGEEHDREET